MRKYFLIAAASFLFACFESPVESIGGGKSHDFYNFKVGNTWKYEFDSWYDRGRVRWVEIKSVKLINIDSSDVLSKFIFEIHDSVISGDNLTRQAGFVSTVIDTETWDPETPSVRFKGGKLNGNMFFPPKKINLDSQIVVKSNFDGRVLYKSKVGKKVLMNGEESLSATLFVEQIPATTPTVTYTTYLKDMGLYHFHFAWIGGSSGEGNIVQLLEFNGVAIKIE